jgi:hypothetical protein
VVDPEGRPVAGAKIIIVHNGDKEEQVSNEDGTFEYFDHTTPVGSSTVRVTITKEGFEQYDTEYNSRELPMNPNVNKEIPSVRVIVLSRKTG